MIDSYDPSVRQYLLTHRDAGKLSQPEDVPDGSAWRYHLAQAPDGEPLFLSSYSKLIDLQKGIAALEGKDVIAFAFLGVLLPVTVGPNRRLKTPSGLYALTPPFAAVTDTGEDLELQTNGFMGPDDLFEIASDDDERKARKQRNTESGTNRRDDDEAGSPV